MKFQIIIDGKNSYTFNEHDCPKCANTNAGFFLRKCVTNESRSVCIGTTSFVVSMSNVLNPTTFLRGKNERKPYVQCMNDDSILYITYI